MLHDDLLTAPVSQLNSNQITATTSTYSSVQSPDKMVKDTEYIGSTALDTVYSDVQRYNRVDPSTADSALGGLSRDRVTELCRQVFRAYDDAAQEDERDGATKIWQVMSAIQDHLKRRASSSSKKRKGGKKHKSHRRDFERDPDGSSVMMDGGSQA